MPKFKYAAKTKDGKTVKEVLILTSKDDLIGRLKAKGLFITSIEEVQEKVGGSSFFSGSKTKRTSIKPQDLAFFARNLATTLSSGVTLLRSLEILSFQAESGGLEKILEECSGHIKGGLSLSESIIKYPRVFSALWRGLIEVGEASGNLPFVLEKLADYLEIRINFERKIKSALVYPTILLIVAIMAIFAFLKFILPRFTTLFEQFDIELPLPTRIVFGISKFFEANFLLIIVGTALLAFGVSFFIKQPKTKKIWDGFKLKIPIFGPLSFLVAMERVTSTIYILLDSGLPLVYTLEVVARSANNSVLEKSLFQVTEKVRGGSALSDEFRRLDFFPLLVSEMAKIGEETGTMPQVFQKISTHYQKDLTIRIERLITAFEPIMIVFIGIVIGGIVISLFMPLFSLSTLGGGS
ncbi:MAG: type II secretion system F family protein [Candidatus Omnitrophota bacterium]